MNESDTTSQEKEELIVPHEEGRIRVSRIAKRQAKNIEPRRVAEQRSVDAPRRFASLMNINKIDRDPRADHPWIKSSGSITRINKVTLIDTASLADGAGAATRAVFRPCTWSRGSLRRRRRSESRPIDCAP